MIIVDLAELSDGPIVLQVVDQVSERPVGRIDIELARVEFLDLGGLRALLAVHERAARAGIAVVVRNPQHYVRPGSAASVRLTRERVSRADDRDRLADEREKMLDERQRRVAAQQQWEGIWEELAEQRETDLERRERDG
ncbi:STAS domain-containing protein [Actinoplanes auranticolor]|uniref:STAS domain-containing protein n=1 Tax=Actinoplanes auranticolor TaxID=47988 RepID=A0A919S487_9ACTN|nr:STAS domain-containing protein [Actinoplanes auranticolor]GIM64791.1 hypothetical protein Aau02nite_12700 [Actinoplanes auranticolor]